MSCDREKNHWLMTAECELPVIDILSCVCLFDDNVMNKGVKSSCGVFGSPMVT